MSNQKKVSIQKEIKAGRSDSKSLTNFKERTAAVMEKLDIPISVYAATEDDGYRKPRTGMWKEYLDDQDFDVEGVDLQGSIFVGDAAGRPRDHSQVDRYEFPHSFSLSLSLQHLSRTDRLTNTVASRSMSDFPSKPPKNFSSTQRQNRSWNPSTPQSTWTPIPQTTVSDDEQVVYAQ